MWRARLGAPRGYRHPCGATVELEWVERSAVLEIDPLGRLGRGKLGKLSVRWGSGFLERDFFVAGPEPVFKNASGAAWWTSKKIREMTELMLMELARGGAGK